MSRYDPTPPFSGPPFSGPSLSEGARTRATVRWFNAAKGFGFVSPEDGTGDAFLHISVLNRIGRHEIGDGAELLCQILPGGKGPQVAHILEVVSEGVVGGAGQQQQPAADRRAAPTGPETEVTGTVKWFKPEQGFGFVTADDGAKDVFVHKSVLRRCNLLELETGQRVHLRVREAPKGREASWVVLL
ncbi:cold-shock protein [Azospirillum rugosum]|uniref:CspA family cold shock protein n=1 Tax=Azospirillum rugosum TaxID=416170 RepID=A0ABS4SRV2_9PROT|nr:cold-shock protein [Azospirillum rugosum]MBP2295286.1 CspA family cold shock protein [Azospirillum rugosum]MDQ0528661.1 CspA family cold shock protein [Azospirillum rugosum]